MIRLLIFLILLVFFCLLLPFVWLAGMVGQLFDKANPGKLVFYYLRALMHLAVFVGGARVEATGLENIPDDETVLYVMNHRSYFDVFVIYTFFKKPTGFVAKKELKYIPFINAYMHLAYCLFLDRKNLRQGLETIKKCIEMIESGISMVIFPEGTRSKDHAHKTTLQEFHGGSFKPAQRTGCRIVPVTIWNSQEVFEAHLPWLKSVPVKIEFGAPIDMNELSKEDRKHIDVYVKNIIQETLVRLDAEA